MVHQLSNGKPFSVAETLLLGLRTGPGPQLPQNVCQQTGEQIQGHCGQTGLSVIDPFARSISCRVAEQATRRDLKVLLAGRTHSLFWTNQQQYSPIGSGNKLLTTVKEFLLIRKAQPFILVDAQIERCNALRRPVTVMRGGRTCSQPLKSHKSITVAELRQYSRG